MRRSAQQSWSSEYRSALSAGPIVKYLLELGARISNIGLVHGENLCVGDNRPDLVRDSVCIHS